MDASSAAVLQRQSGQPFGSSGGAAVPGWLTRLVMPASVLAAGLMLIWPAFWNGFPLVFADSGTYLGQALIGYVGWDRPPFYSLFLLVTDLRLSLWLPILVQGLVMAHLLSLVLRALGWAGPVPLLMAALGLAGFTALPWFAAQLMPDIGTGMVVLALWLLGFRVNVLTRWERLWLWLLACAAVAMHQSHLPLALGLCVVGGALLWRRMGLRAARPALLRMAGPPLVAVLAIMSANFAAHGRLSISPFGSVFLATRMIYDGPAMNWLRQACPENGMRICPVLDRLGVGHNTFLWAPDSPLHHELGGAKAWAPEAGRIILATLAHDPGGVAAAFLRNTWRQLGHAATGDGLEPWPGVPGPEPLIARFFPQELEAFRAARQYRGLLLPEARSVAPLHQAASLAGAVLLTLLLLLRGRRLSPAGLALGLLVLAAILGNAMITGGLSGPAERYQARILWLLAFVPLPLALGLRPVPGQAALLPVARRPLG